jgi:5-hydroxyisourate hydrolase
MAITTHVLDTSRGKPAAGIAVTLERSAANGTWSPVGRGTTDNDGRLRTLTTGDVEKGTYRLTFETGTAFYPQVVIIFNVADGAQHYHVPLLISPWGYTTYRGS